MAFHVIRIDTTDTGFPLLSEQSGRSVIIPSADEQSQIAIGDAVKGITQYNSPGTYYAENVLPSINGYKSVAYEEMIAPYIFEAGTFLALGNKRFSDLVVVKFTELTYSMTQGSIDFLGLKFNRILEIRGDNEIRTYIATMLGGYVWIYSLTTNTWKELAVNGWNGLGEISVAIVFANGSVIPLLCLENFGIWKINITTEKLEEITLTGNIIKNQIKAIASSYNFLILCNDQYVQWSSAFDPLDFDLTKALETGTGFGVPLGLTGTITTLLSTQQGFIVCSDANVVSVSWSGNTLFPWVFNPIRNSAGVMRQRNILESKSIASWTIAGLMEMTYTDADSIYPEVTDYLSARCFETWNDVTQSPVATFTDTDPIVQVSSVDSRYLLISHT